MDLALIDTAARADKVGYAYKSLPFKDSIRLLSLDLSQPDCLSCFLTIIDHLSDCPPYDALSYTWGNPQFPYSESYIESPQAAVPTIPIKCDNAIILVTANLGDALKRVSEIYKSAAGGMKSDKNYIWIDSICINQTDIDERATQVNLMGELYSRAKRVYAWVGHEDEFTTDAMTVFHSISSIPPEQQITVTIGDFSDSKIYAKLGIPPVTYRNWIGYIAFMNRPYFERKWVVQELVLAQNVSFLCGSLILDGPLVERTQSFVGESKWFSRLHYSILIDHVKNGQKPACHRRMLDGNLGPGLSASSAIYVKRVASSRKAHFPLHQLLVMLRSHKASDKRDCIYALLGICNRDSITFKDYPDGLVPNYRDHPWKLFTQTTRLIMISHQSLDMLSYIDTHRISNGFGDDYLPSWVPDYSEPLNLNPLHQMGGHCPWKAAGELELSSADSTTEIGSPLLRVQGVCLGYIENFAEGGGQDADFYLLWGGFARVALGMNFPHNDTSEGISQLNILWRTIIADTFPKQYPTPASFVDSVLWYLIVGMFCAARAGEGEDRNNKNSTKTVYSIMAVLTNPDADGGESFEEAIIRLVKTPSAIPFFRLLASEPPDSPFAPAQVEKALHQMLSDLKSPEMTLAKWVDLMGRFSDRLSWVMSHRRLFRLNRGPLGIGPAHLQNGDQVWILTGARSPYVLRAVDDSDNAFRLVGESYVYGMMDGEGLRLGHDLSDIVLQ